MKLDVSWQIFEKSSNIKFHEKSPVEADMLHANRRRDRQTDTTKLIFAFRKFSNAPKNQYEFKCAAPKSDGTIELSTLKLLTSEMGSSVVFR
jgi:hypothetical protein